MTGTMLELAELWELTNKGFINPAKPNYTYRRFLDAIGGTDGRGQSSITNGKAVEIKHSRSVAKKIFKMFLWLFLDIFDFYPLIAEHCRAVENQFIGFAVGVNTKIT